MIRDLGTLIRSMDATLHADAVAFCVATEGAALPTNSVIATVREAEGLTVVLFERDATALGIAPAFRAEWITLNVHSDLEAVGLTAAFSNALADAGISCNVIAGVHHDHIFVPHGTGARALATLRALSARPYAAGR